MEGLQVPDQPVEVTFPDADLPYLFVAALRRRVGDGALTGAVVVPSDAGPAVVLLPDLARDEAVLELIELLEGSIVEAAAVASSAGGGGG